MKILETQKDRQENTAIRSLFPPQTIDIEKDVQKFTNELRKLPATFEAD